MILTAIFIPKSGKESALLSLLHTQAQHSWREPGVLSYVVNEVPGERRSFMNVEIYESSEAFRLHEEMEYTKSFKVDLAGLVEVPPTVFIGTTLFTDEHSKSSL